MHRVGRWLWAGVIIAVFSAANIAQPAPANAQADSGNFTLLDWWWRSPVIEYRVNLNGAPPGALQAVQAAAQTWNDVPGAQVELRYVGSTTSAASVSDGTNVIYWGPLAGSAIGETLYFLRTECDPSCETRPTEFDMRISSTDPITVNAIGTQNFDLESLILHEFGHALGLDHTNPPTDTTQVMKRVLIGGTHVRTLGSGDQRAVQIRYPNSDGDVNCDGLVNIVDALAVAQYSVDVRQDVGRCPVNGSHPRGSLFALMGDANGDSQVNVADAFLVAKCAVGLSTPICSG